MPLGPCKVGTIGCKGHCPSLTPRLLVERSNRHQEFTDELSLTWKTNSIIISTAIINTNQIQVLRLVNDVLYRRWSPSRHCELWFWAIEIKFNWILRCIFTEVCWCNIIYQNVGTTKHIDPTWVINALRFNAGYKCQLVELSCLTPNSYDKWHFNTACWEGRDCTRNFTFTRHQALPQLTLPWWSVLLKRDTEIHKLNLRLFCGTGPRWRWT